MVSANGHRADIGRQRVVLIVDPAQEADAQLCAVLIEAGFEVRSWRAVEELPRILAVQPVAMILLAHQLPGADTLAVLRRIVDTHCVPTIIVADKSKPLQRILALEMGADDFITKPCEPEEILARVRAVLRRSLRASSAEQAGPTPTRPGDETFRFDGLVFDLGRRELRATNGELIELTSTEIDLLGAFVVQPQIPLSRLAIIDKIGKGSNSASIRTIDVLISKLRRKIEASADQPELIKTVRGSGYVFTPKSLDR